MPPTPAEVVHRSNNSAPLMRLAQGSPGSVHKKTGAAVEASRAELTGGAAKTIFRLDLSTGVQAEIFTLANPYRVVVDLPDVTFRLPPGTGKLGRGLISAFRFGLLAEGKARIVLDTPAPVVISKAEMTPREGGVQLAIEIAPTSTAEFGAGTGGQRSSAQKPASPEALADVHGQAEAPRQAGDPHRCRPRRHRPGRREPQQPVGEDGGAGGGAKGSRTRWQPMGATRCT